MSVKDYYKTVDAESLRYRACSLDRIFAINMSGFVAVATENPLSLKWEFNAQGLKFYDIDGVYLNDEGQEVVQKTIYLLPYCHEKISFSEFFLKIEQILRKSHHSVMLVLRPSFLDSKAYSYFFESDFPCPVDYENSCEKLAESYCKLADNVKPGLKFLAKGYRIPKNFNDGLLLQKQGFCW